MMIETLRRRSFIRALASLILLVVVSARAADAPSVHQAKHIRLLAIGNSFSGNATHYLPNIVDAAGDKLTFGTISIGGCPLQKHWTNALAFQNGSTGPDAVAWKKLTAEKWDFVTIQQYSMFSYKIETYRPFAKQLHDYIQSQVPSAEILVHETWAYRADDPLFKKDFSQQDMYWQVRSAYETIAGEIGSRVIPVGDAFENARRDSAWGGVFPDPKFDIKNAQFPNLPDQTHSLNRGYAWAAGKDGKQALKMDGHHASTAGEYLAAAVWFEFLYGHSVEGNRFVPKDLKPDDATIIQRIAHQTVTGGLRPAKTTL